MLSRQVNKLIKEGEKGVAELYKQHIKYFNLVDEWAERLTNGDLLDEYEITQCMDRLTGCLMKLGTVSGALEAIKEEMEQGCRVKGFAKAGKLNQPAIDVVKAEARNYVSKIRKWHSDFKTYYWSAEKGVTTAQSRLKRLTVEKGAKRVDRTGETPVEETYKDTDSTNNPPGDYKPDNTGDNNEW